MTDNLQLQTSRLTNASDGNLIDDSISDIENAVSVLFGITKDTPIDQVMSIAAGGDVTMIGDLILSGAPTNALHCATKLYADDNAAFGAGGSYIVETGSNLEDTTVANAATEFLEFKGDDESAGWSNVEVGEDAQFDYDTDKTKIVCKSSGDYLIQCMYSAYYIDVSIYDPFEWHMSLYVNGVKAVDNAASEYVHDPRDDIHSYFVGTFAVMRTLAANDYLQVACTNPNTQPDHFMFFFNKWFGMTKLG